MPGGRFCMRIKMKNPFPEAGRRNFSCEGSSQLVHLHGHAALLAGSSVLVKDPLFHGLVHRLHSSLEGGVGQVLVAGSDGGVELLHSGLERGLRSLVTLVLNLGDQNSFLCGFDVGHGLHLLWTRCYVEK